MGNTSKHTPGPWITGSADNHSRRVILGPTNGISRVIIARMPGEYRENHAVWPTVEANAHLIAAAPAMYEALQGMLDWARRVNTLNPGPEILNALNVIAQAEGRQ